MSRPGRARAYPADWSRERRRGAAVRALANAISDLELGNFAPAMVWCAIACVHVGHLANEDTVREIVALLNEQRAKEASAEA